MVGVLDDQQSDGKGLDPRFIALRLQIFHRRHSNDL